MNTNKHGIMIVENRAVFSIVMELEKENTTVALLSNEWGIDTESIEEALEIYAKYPDEVQRDAITAQTVDYEQKYREREKALNMVLTDCQSCTEGNYRWKNPDFETTHIRDPNLHLLECDNCGHEPI